MEFVLLIKYSTENEYPEGSLVYYHSLGEGSYGLLICTPNGEFFLEEIPSYGGDPHFWGEVASIQHGIRVFTSWT